MKKTFLFFISLIITCPSLLAEKIGVLSTILKPNSIIIDANNLLVAEGAEISIYKLDSLKFVKKFGGIGEGPGEFLPDSLGRVGFSVHPDFIFVHNRFRIFYFSRDGELIKEKKVPHALYGITPMEDKFVAYAHDIQDNDISLTIVLYDSQFKKIREISRGDYNLQKNGKINVFPEFPRFCVHHDKLFILKGNGNLVLDVWDKNGGRLYRSEQKFARIELTEKFKEKVLDWLKDRVRPAYFWKEFQSRLFFPDYLPLVRDVKIIDDTIYIQTFNTGKNKVEFIAMDLKGNLKKRILLDLYEPDLINTIPFSLKNGSLYYLVENEDEDWELYKQAI